MNHNPFKIITIQGNPFDRGHQYGTQCKQMIEDNLVFYQQIFEKNAGLSWTASLERANEFLAPIGAFDPQILEEMKGIAAGAHCTLEEILALNARSELLFLSKAVKQATSHCCTSLAALPGSTRESGVIMAQNWDWYTDVRDRCVLLKITQPGRPGILQFVEAGIVGKIGINASGIGLCTNALVSDNWCVGVPYHVILRGILNAATMGEAVGAVLKSKRGSSGNYLIGHADCGVINIEASPDQTNILYPEAGILSHTNHYKTCNPRINDILPGIWPDSLIRDLRAQTLLKQGNGDITTETIKTILQDHFDYPNSICAHPTVSESGEAPSQTNASIIMDLGQNTFHIAKGPLCEHKFLPIDTDHF
jgi:isopenicillin-N N-acyltransferase-like protein